MMPTARRQARPTLPAVAGTPAAIVAGLLTLVALAAVAPVTSEARLPVIRALAPLATTRQIEATIDQPVSAPCIASRAATNVRATGSTGVRAAASWRTLDLPPPAIA